MVTTTQERPGASMRAAVLRAWDDIGVEEVPLPELGQDEVLCKVVSCGLCGTDLKLVAGGFAGRWPPALPFVIGHEWVGKIAHLGPGVARKDLRVGDRVVAENHAGCGSCRMCRAGRYNLCELVREPGYKLYGHTAPGALADYAVRPAVVLHKIPDQIGDVEAALINQAALAYHGIRRSRLQPGSTVAVFGPGLVGLMTVQIARAVGATRVITVGRGQRLRLAAELGSDVTVDYEQEDPVEAIRRASDGRGADCVYECAGNPAVLPQAIGSVARGGAVALLGLAGREARAELSPDALTLDELDLLGVRSSPNAYPPTIALMASGAIATGPLTRDVYPLEEVPAALQALRERTALRPIIRL